jgi:hypothetical protein
MNVIKKIEEVAHPLVLAIRMIKSATSAAASAIAGALIAAACRTEGTTLRLGRSRTSSRSRSVLHSDRCAKEAS